MKENVDTLWEIDALWLTLHNYFASTIAFDTRSIRGISVGRFGVNGFCRLRKAVGKKEYNFIEFYIYNFSIDI